jgi:Family of unknown function (DUF5317)
LNQYPIWIGLVFILVMVCVMSNPAWWMLVALGVGANGLVLAGNNWKMPVRGSVEETIRHAPMGNGTRHRWLGDIIPTGFGKASVGDVLLAAGILGVSATRGALAHVIAVLCLAWWASGWAKGFRLFEKWTAEARSDCRKNIPIVMILMLIGNLLNFKGCSVGALRASAEGVGAAMSSRQAPKPSIKPPSKWRDLGAIASPSPGSLRRLRELTAKQEEETKKEAATKSVATAQNSLTSMFSASPKSARSGPFCRVTCAAHHGGQYDVETVPELCRANWIPPTAQWVPGWYAISDKEEITNPWPGPAQSGFEKYKLYWSGIQSEAKVIHGSQP